MGRSSHAGTEAMAAHAGHVGERRPAAPAGAEPHQFRHPEFRHSSHQGGAGTDLRASDHARRRGAVRDGRDLAGPDGLCEVRRGRGAAGAGRTAFQVFALARNRSPVETQARVEEARCHRRRKTAAGARDILVGREPSALGGPPIPHRASAEQHRRAAATGTLVSAAAQRAFGAGALRGDHPPARTECLPELHKYLADDVRAALSSSAAYPRTLKAGPGKHF